MRDDVFRRDCPARMVLDHLAGRWSILVLTALAPGDLRFFELRDRIEGVSEKMLAQTLRTLVRDGFVHRTVEPAVPPRVSYGLTALGAGVTEPLGALTGWIRRNAGNILAAQDDYDASGA
ncbi:winged helix-turn-helix transcriptional regulator [Actinomadura atramentaria]|uniref:winged helix-turn-helix transcriptional regulator n=1 Tax=Actinomadura atramentaria TaxID=1990 RepID=UPI0003683DFB|nr:helix-turn-helix domain-containing protein [Actinomadura atramentaria]